MSPRISSMSQWPLWQMSLEGLNFVKTVYVCVVGVCLCVWDVCVCLRVWGEQGGVLWQVCVCRDECVGSWVSERVWRFCVWRVAVWYMCFCGGHGCVGVYVRTLCVCVRVQVCLGGTHIGMSVVQGMFLAFGGGDGVRRSLWGAS